MKKLKTWQLILLIIFYPIVIIYFIIWLCKKAKPKPQNNSVPTIRVEYTGIPQQSNHISRDELDKVRIINDSLNIIANTTNADTFFSRYALIMKTFDDVEKERQAGKTHKVFNHYYSYRVENCKDEFIDSFIRRSYSDTLIKAAELTTSAGRENRVIKFFSELETYENQMFPQNINQLRALKSENSTSEQITNNINNASAINQAVDNTYIQFLVTMISPNASVLSHEFYKNNYSEIQRRCEEFKNLSSAAYSEKDINNKIELLEKTLVAFNKVRQWFYNYSEGAKIYFFNEYEHTSNSKTPHFNWANNITEELNLQRLKQYGIIPWISGEAEKGFVQNEIYKAFPDTNKSFLRDCIDELTDAGIINKEKRGNTFYISKK